MEKVTFDAEVTKDPVFETQLKGIIAEFESERRTAEVKAKEHGNKLKSSPLLRLMDEGKFNAPFILSEFPKVADKTSARNYRFDSLQRRKANRTTQTGRTRP